MKCLKLSTLSQNEMYRENYFYVQINYNFMNFKNEITHN